MVAGIFFDDESFTINTCSTKVEWVDSVWQMPEFLRLKAGKSAYFSVKSGPDHDGSQMVMEKIPRTGKRWHYLHQTDFTSRIPGSQKTRNSEGFCEDNLPQQMSEQNSQGRGVTGVAYNSNTRPSQAGRQFLLAYQIQWWLLF